MKFRRTFEIQPLAGTKGLLHFPTALSLWEKGFQATRAFGAFKGSTDASHHVLDYAVCVR